MNHSEGFFKGNRDANLFYQAWIPDGKVRAVVLIVHGLGEHTGRYVNHVNFLVPLGYAVYGLDHLGHGKSDGKQEILVSFADYLEPLALFTKMVKDWQPGKPIFILGHSMGGLITCNYLLDHQSDFNGAILSAPAVKVGDNITSGTILMSKVLSAILPEAGILALDANGISRDPAVVKAYVNDPLVFHGKTPARLASEMLKGMIRVTAEAKKIIIPLLIIQGGDDKLIDPSGAKMLYEAVTSTDKTLKLYSGLYHEVHNEPERDQMFSDLEIWLKAHS
jgi:acylglycerol lipase